jgi:hypothetical protein
MGIDLICDQEHWSDCYSNWSNLRSACVKATFEYIKQFIENNSIQTNKEEIRLQKKIMAYIDKINAYKSDDELFIVMNLHLFNGFLEECKNIEFIDLLIKFGVLGIYTLCYKRDNEGYYSVGNAYDICDLFSLIRDFTLDNKDDIYASENIIYRNIKQIERVFQESVCLKRIITIF